jgi:hypothetical protein
MTWVSSYCLRGLQHQFKGKTHTDNFDKKVSLAVENEINFEGDSDLSELKEKITSISTQFRIPFEEEINQLDRKIARIDHEAERDIDLHPDSSSSKLDSDYRSEFREIKDIFQSLVDK